jgi:maltose O-acetyltransferase
VSLVYLIKNREVPKGLSVRWFVVWVKRVINLPTLLRILFFRIVYLTKGATLGDLSIIGYIEVNGSLKNLKVGERTFISDGVHMALHDFIEVGNRVVINSKVQLLTATHATSDPEWKVIKKKILIKDYAWIANGAIILPGVTIGRGAVVGAGAVVSRDIPDYSISVGNPALIIDKKRPENINYSPVDLVACFEAWLGRKKQ